MFKVRIDKETEVSLEKSESKRQKVVEHRGPGGEESKPVTVKREERKVGRNEPKEF